MIQACGTPPLACGSHSLPRDPLPPHGTASSLPAGPGVLAWRLTWKLSPEIEKEELGKMARDEVLTCKGVPETCECEAQGETSLWGFTSRCSGRDEYLTWEGRPRLIHVQGPHREVKLTTGWRQIKQSPNFKGSRGRDYTGLW